MANFKRCDRCGGEAIAEMEFKTSTTTPIKADLCIECVALAKKTMRVFTGQEVSELAVEVVALGEMDVDAQRPIKS